jgi:hypothetical protein
VVARLLAKEKVASSNLVFRSNFLSWRRGQVVKAGVCKTPIAGSIPAVASTPSPVDSWAALGATRRLER